jgi:hypothetical protein
MSFTSPITNTNSDPDFPYSVPSRQCEPIIDCAILNFHDKTIPNPLSSKLSTENDQDKDKTKDQDHLTFGLLNLKIRDEIPIAKNLEITYMVDCSASMAEYAADRNTKMFHVLHTLKNMITIFHKLDKKTNIKLKVNSFDNKTYTNVDTGDNNVSESYLPKLIEQLNLIEPRGCTNIELALLHTNTNSNRHLNKNNVDKIHLLLTDGCITAGSENVEYLKTLVSPHYTNYFIGYGLDHDAALLTELSSTGKHNEYRFVDALEKAGLVYGEIIHDILYKALEDVVLSATNCEIYDYQTNTWTTQLEIGHLSSEQKKTYQIRAEDPDKALIAISARSLHKTRAHQQLSNDVVFQTHASCVSKKCDLSDYFLRQQTQELLYKVKDMLSIEQKDKKDNSNPTPDPNNLYAYYNLNPTPLEPLTKENNQEKEEKRRKIQEQKIVLKEELKSFLNFLLDYITLHKKEKDLFLRTLCDDIFIAYKTINSIKGAMFVNSRQTSQGRQQTYSAKSNFDDTNSNNPNQQIPNYLRQASVADPLSVDLDMLPPSPPKMQRTPSLSAYRDHINSNNNQTFEAQACDLNYTMTQDDDSAYASIGVVKMMRDVSMGSYSTPDPDPDPDHVPDTNPVPDMKLSLDVV